MINDAKRYFAEDEMYYHTNQQIIGIKAFFRGVIVKEWVVVNDENVNYHEHNRILVKSFARFYHEFQKERCEALHTENKQREVLEEETKNMKEEATKGTIKGLKNYADSCEIDEKEEKVSTMKSWRSGFRSFVRNAPKTVHSKISG